MITTTNGLAPAELPIAGAVLASGDARADLAQALGRAEAGERVTAALAGEDLPRIADLLQDAARRQLACVVRATLSDGDGGLFAVADSGAVILVACPAELPSVHLIARMLAERALLPVVLAAAGPAAEARDLPAAALDLLGEAGDFVRSATPSQEQLFGRDRRRVVRWFDLERPVLRGQPSDPALATLQRAGFAPFVQAPVMKLLQDVAAEVQLATGSVWSAVDTAGCEHADVLVIGLATCPAALGVPLEVTGRVTLNCLRPFPESWQPQLRGKKAVIVLSAAVAALAEPPLLREVRAALAREQAEARVARRPFKDKEVPSLHVAVSARADGQVSSADLAAFVRECAEGAGRPFVQLGVRFAPLDVGSRKRLVLHEALRRAHPGIETLGLSDGAPAARQSVPAAPRRVDAPAQSAPTHDDRLRAWDVVVSAKAADLGPDPYLTAGSSPALTSLFRGNAATDQLPSLTTSRCTGCGACWTACPDAALLPAVIGAGELIECGMRAVAATADSAEALRPVVARVAKALPKAITAGAATAGDAVRAASAAALVKLDEARRGPAQQAADAVADALAALPVVGGAPFTGGEPLVLALDPDACKGCNLCVAACEPGALQPGSRSAEAVRQARAGAAAWRALPDTTGAVIAAARELPEPGLLGALELSRHCLVTMAPGDDAEPGSGARLALRSVLAATEAHLQPKLLQHVQRLDELAAKFGERIRGMLAGALPVTDLEALHEGLATLGAGAVALSTLAGRLDEVQASGRVDAGKLQLLVETARAVADLRFRVQQGHSGSGRARSGIVLAGGEAGALAGAFPWNPFASPAVFDGRREAGQHALGLLHGQAAALAADFALLRRAEALLQQGPPGPRRLDYAELSLAERELCPPLWLVVDGDALRRGGLAQVTAALASGLPIKVLLLTSSTERAADPSPARLALAHPGAFVLQSTVAHLDHLAAGVLGACEHPGPALLHVFAPSPRAAAVAPDRTMALAEEAVARRAFPLLRYDPRLPGAFGEKLSLDGNPEPQAPGTDDPEHLPAWQMLQELAGVRTPFTHEVEQRAAAAVAAAHERELAALRAEHAVELQRLRGGVEAELLARLQRKLTTLAAGARP